LLASRPFSAPPYLTAIYWRILKTTDPEVLPKGLKFCGTGAFIAPTLVLTAAHILPYKDWEDDEYVYRVIRQSKIQMLVKVKGKLFKAKVVIFPPDADIAVLKVIGIQVKDYLPVAFDLPSAGTTLTVVSWRPLRETAAPPLKPVIWDLTVDNPTLKRTWGVTKPIQEELIYGHPQAWGGASGSPALLNGKVVGVVVGITPNSHTLIEPVRKIQKTLSTLLATKSH
jgi:V8-like Glu-specific endopeptidase